MIRVDVGRAVVSCHLVCVEEAALGSRGKAGWLLGLFLGLGHARDGICAQSIDVHAHGTEVFADWFGAQQCHEQVQGINLVMAVLMGDCGRGGYGFVGSSRKQAGNVDGTCCLGPSR